MDVCLLAMSWAPHRCGVPEGVLEEENGELEAVCFLEFEAPQFAVAVILTPTQEETSRPGDLQGDNAHFIVAAADLAEKMEPLSILFLVAYGFEPSFQELYRVRHETTSVSG